MNKTAIKNFAVEARQKLIDDIKYKARMIGVSENGIAEALPQSTDDLKFFDVGTKNYVELSGEAIKQRAALVSAIKNKERELNNYSEAFDFVVEKVAYTWFNRLIAIRFMEVNDYLPSRVRVLSSENSAKLEPDFVTNPFDTDLDFTPYEQDRIIQLKDENKLDALFRMLFIKQCNKLNEILPELFEKIEDYTELLLTIAFTDKDGVVYKLTHDIAENDFNIEAEGQVEIIGWMYQYYNIEPKAAVFAKPKGSKTKKEEVPAATQLFTPDWIVRYMVENSVGRIWVEGHPNKSLQDSWKYYLEEAEQEENVKKQLESIHNEYKNLTPEQIKVIDPCMGSGHILVYAFDVLMQIYESYGYTQRDAVRSILQNNIYGLDIDERAYQLSYFAVMMKARQYNRRILSEGITPNLCVIRNSVSLPTSSLNKLGEYKNVVSKMINESLDAEEYGSVLNLSIKTSELNGIETKLSEIEKSKDDANLIERLEIDELLDSVIPLIKQSRILAKKYEVVATNPPYIPVSSMGPKINDYVKKNYPDSKTDLFAVFIERCNQMLIKNGLQAMITMHSWMFLVSYESLRKKIANNKSIVNMIHLGARAFEEIGGEVVQTTSWIQRNWHNNLYSGTYCRLVESNTQSGKEEMYLSGDNRFVTTQSNYLVIPSAPFAYWVNKNVYDSYSNPPIGNTIIPRHGLATSDNNRFLKLWFEININKGAMFEKDRSKKWFPMNKGGSYRKWYGNNEWVINYENDGKEIKDFAIELYNSSSRTIQNTQFYFLDSITWSALTSGPLSFRYSDNGAIFGSGAHSAFADNENSLLYGLGLMNSKINNMYLNIVSATLNKNVDDIRSTPFIYSNEDCDSILDVVDANINLSKTDWNMFENSWDFEEHPLVMLASGLWDCTAIGASMSYYYGANGPDPKDISGSLELCYLLWQGECNDRFNKLKANEEELNRIFIDIYGLQDELTPEVEDKDVTVRKADLQRDIKSLISYAVGCMFGRYSLKEKGLVFAGGKWDETKYSEFRPDEDNCIPITDEEYFEDDIVGRFVEFVKVVFGKEDLEANLNYIANALGNKGNTSREIIRNYFLNDFIKDHIKMYQKRPIYWMFDSGKQNGFKSLVYMHRWNADTTGNMRVEYLHRMQRVYEKEIERMQEIIDNSRDNKEIAYASKRKEKLQKQIKETKDYDAKVAHLALSRIDIDLDDGFKVNYEKVQTAPDGKEMQILAKI